MRDIKLKSDQLPDNISDTNYELAGNNKVNLLVYFTLE